VEVEIFLPNSIVEPIYFGSNVFLNTLLEYFELYGCIHEPAKNEYKKFDALFIFNVVVFINDYKIWNHHQIPHNSKYGLTMFWESFRCFR